MSLIQQELELHYQLGKKHAKNENLIKGILIGFLIAIALTIAYWYF